MPTLNPILSLSSVEVYLNKLPPRDPKATYKSVARAHALFTLNEPTCSISYGTIALRGIHVMMNTNGGIFISFPGKARENGRYMEFASLTGPIMSDVRNAVVSEYWRKINAAKAQASAVPTVDAATPSTELDTASRLRSALAIFGKAEKYKGSFPDALAIHVVDASGDARLLPEVLERVEQNQAPSVYHVVLTDSAGATYDLCTGII